jgi:prepilin-type N-terminal cleavage/methylation domain-containing protein
MKLSQLKNNNFGFTLIEMLVSLSIIGLLAGTFLVNYHSYGQTGNLNLAAHKLASDIRQVQNLTLGLKDFNGTSPLGGWGINIQKGGSSYLIFADKDSSRTYTDSTELYRQINLPSDIKIENIRGVDSSGISYATANTLNIIFEPPDPVTHLNADSLTNCRKVKIILKLNSQNKTSTTTINLLGLIDVQNN